MQKSTFLIVATLSVLAANAITGTPPRGSGQDERAKKVDELFSPWDTASTPGAVVAVIRDGTIIYQQAYGMADLERDSPLSPESVFDIASISKQFVAMSILLLQEQGKLSLDDDIRSYLPEFSDYGQTITIRHLIHHTSGIRDYMDLMELAGMRWENSYHQSEIVDLVARQHIFEPLNMKVSHFYEDYRRVQRLEGGQARGLGSRLSIGAATLPGPEIHRDYPFEPGAIFSLEARGASGRSLPRRRIHRRPGNGKNRDRSETVTGLNLSFGTCVLRAMLR